MNLWQVLSRSRRDTMQQNSRSIATAASLFICSYDMWVWWGRLCGCMTAKSVLLNTVIVSKASCVGPWHNQKMLKCAPSCQGPAATWRKLNWYLFYEMLYLQLCCKGQIVSGRRKVNEKWMPLKKTNKVKAFECGGARTGGNGCMMIIYLNWRSDIIALNL